MALDFLAQASICKQAVEKALPIINQTWKKDYNKEELIYKIGSNNIFEAQKTIRAGRGLGLSETIDNKLIDELAGTIQRMYIRVIE